jgi:hypothetical protein
VAAAAKGAIAELGAFAAQVEAAHEALMRREPVTALQVADLEREHARLGVWLAAIATALERLETSGLSAGEAHQAAELPERAQAVHRRLTAAWRRWAQEGVRASGHGLEEDYPALQAAASGALEEAEGFLSQSPLDVARAELSVDRADRCLDSYALELTEEIERERRRQAERVDR